MSNLNAKAGEKIALVGVISPQTVTSTEVFSNVVDMSQFHQVLGTVTLGDMANEAIDFTCYTCTSTGGTAVSLKASTQLGASASANDNKQIMLNVRSEELGASAQYIKFGLKTGATVGGMASVLIQGVDGRFGPESACNLATVLEVKL